jgi:hypothetical protein
MGAEQGDFARGLPAEYSEGSFWTSTAGLYQQLVIVLSLPAYLILIVQSIEQA